MRQGEKYVNVEVEITELGVPVDIDNIEEVEFMFGPVTKKYPDDATFTDNKFYITFEEADTLQFGTHVVAQNKVRFVDGDTILTNKQLMLVNTILRKE